MKGPFLFLFNSSLFNIYDLSAQNRSSDKIPPKQLSLSIIVKIDREEISSLEKVLLICPIISLINQFSLLSYKILLKLFMQSSDPFDFIVNTPISNSFVS